MTMRPIVFFRDGMFYPTEYPSNYSDWQAEADRNPGTIRIEDAAGNVLWPAPTNASIPEPVAIAAIETIFRSVGRNFREELPAQQAAAIEAMRGVLMAERERAALVVALYSDHPNAAVAFVADEITTAIRKGEVA